MYFRMKKRTMLGLLKNETDTGDNQSFNDTHFSAENFWLFRARACFQSTIEGARALVRARSEQPKVLCRETSIIE